MDLENIKQSLKVDIPAIFLALKSNDVSFLAKIFGVITVGYALSPIDLIPDFIPILGYLDDLIILPLLATITIKLIPKDVFEKYRKLAENLWIDGKPKKWYYAIPIVAIWILIIVSILKIFM
ncbi:MAG: YkvA family protein [Oscillospiraceae bacterium]